MPRISVILPIFNAGKYLKTAVNSLLNQTFKDFEIIIINDGSEDDGADIIKAYNDKRIRFIDDNNNLGASERFNQGIELSTGEYIAHMGADDISLPKRFEFQLRALEGNPQIGICGSDLMLFNDNKKIGKWFYPAHHDAIMVRQFSFPGFGHPSVLIRKNILIANNLFYSKTCYPAEDYEMWYRLLKLTNGINIKQTLLLYRISQDQVSNKKRDLVKHNSNIIRKLYLKDLNLDSKEDLYDYHCSLITDRWQQDTNFFYTAFEWFNKIVNANKKTPIFNEYLLLQDLAERAFYKCYEETNSEFNGIKIYYESWLGEYFKPHLKYRIKSIIKKNLKLV